ncbi:hypothetical protein [Sinorhizobium sp. BG8]|uniref:hypothetical protein n=1 Tax=Sinorhizobium sp. BG8 TaxID=2613773 RepID=UPI0032B153D3
MKDDDDQLIETLFRNGTLTVVGIVLSFSLGFVTQWTSNPIPWQIIDLPALLLLVLGIVLQIITLKILLHPISLKRTSYDKANRLFMCGVVATSSGVFMAILTDFIELMQK